MPGRPWCRQIWDRGQRGAARPAAAQLQVTPLPGTTPPTIAAVPAYLPPTIAWSAGSGYRVVQPAAGWSGPTITLVLARIAGPDLAQPKPVHLLLENIYETRLFVNLATLLETTGVVVNEVFIQMTNKQALADYKYK